MKSLSYLTSFSLAALFLSGCATDSNGPTSLSSSTTISHNELARAAQIPGTLIIETIPIGATIVIGDRPPITTPARVSDLRAGPYRIQIAYPGYESEIRDTEIKAALVTSLTIELKKIAGAIDLTSTPTGLPFELKASEGPAAALPPITGTTPANLKNITPGNYTVAITQPGRKPYQQSITVNRETTTTVAASWPTNEIWAERSGKTVKLSWFIAPGTYRSFELMRNTQERPAGRTRVAPLRSGVTNYEDKLSADGRFWYWIKITAESGETINVGPVEAISK